MERMTAAKRAEDAILPDVFATFHKWMADSGFTERTMRTYVRTIIRLEDQYARSLEEIATEQFFVLVKDSPDRAISPAVRHFIRFWSTTGKALWRSGGPWIRAGFDKLYQLVPRGNRCQRPAIAQPPRALGTECKVVDRPGPSEHREFSEQPPRALAMECRAVVRQSPSEHRELSHPVALLAASWKSSRIEVGDVGSSSSKRQHGIGCVPNLPDVGIAKRVRTVEHTWMSAHFLRYRLEELSPPAAEDQRQQCHPSMWKIGAAHKSIESDVKVGSMKVVMSEELKKILHQIESCQGKVAAVSEVLRIKMPERTRQVAALQEQRNRQLHPIQERMTQLEILVLKADEGKEKAKVDLLQVKDELSRCIEKFASAHEVRELEESRNALSTCYEKFIAKPAEAIQLDADRLRLQREQEQAVLDLRTIREDFKSRVEALGVVKEVRDLEERQEALRLELGSLRAMQRGFVNAAGVG